MNSQQVLDTLKNYVANTLLQGQDGGLDAETPLLEWGVLDSLRMVTLMSFIEKEFAVKVPDEEMVPDNFVNLRALAEMVARLAQKKAS
jgi:acyl carrier protein